MNGMIHYRPEIDGLRAVAVFSVVIFHAKFSQGNDSILLSGGYLGVDIFFVISGYLITSIILRRLEKGRFSFTDFYIRRAKRILPALFLVTFTTLPFAWYFLLPQEMIEYAHSLLSTIFFYSNFQFLSEDPYWATSGELKPLLHTWSLAVEEQYYFVMPVIIVVVYKLAKTALIWVLLSLFILSFSIAIVLTPSMPETSFFMLPFRLWELIAGGLLAWIEVSRGERRILRGACMILPVSVAAIIWSFIKATEHSVHPHWITLVPVLATMAIIWFANPKERVTRVLSSKPLVWIGLISYALYLWHYPLFAFVAASEFPVNAITKCMVIVLAVLLSILTYLGIEKPIRFYNSFSSLRLLTATSTLIVAIVGFATMINLSEGYKLRLNELYALYGSNEPSNRLLQVSTWQPQLTKNKFSRQAKFKVLIHGDSHAKDLFNALDSNKYLLQEYDFLRSKYTFTNSKTNKCFATDPKRFNKLLNSDAYRQANFILISDYFSAEWHLQCLQAYLSNVDVVDKPHILFSSQNFYLPRMLDESVIDRVEKLRHKNHWINLYYARNSLRKLTESDWVILSSGKFSRADGEALKYQAISNESRMMNNRLATLATQYHTEYVDKYQYLCSENRRICAIFTESGKKIYFDGMHLTINGAKYMGAKIIEHHLKPIFKRYHRFDTKPTESHWVSP